jgi:hypothetical protein
MNFRQIKAVFRNLSGRYDLVDDDADETIEHLINEASRTLDRSGENPKSWGSHFEQLAIDSYVVSIPLCRAIKEVWVSTASAHYQLEKEDLANLVSMYLSESNDSGSPLSYSPVITRKIPEDADLSTLTSFLTYVETQTGLDHDYNALIVMPKVSEAMLVEVKGLFYSARLVEDDDTNYWTTVHPLTLIKAVMYELEVFNQNKSKTDLWRKALNDDLIGINKDLVEQLISEVDQMEG